MGDVRKSLTCGNDAPESCRGTRFGDSRNAFSCLRHGLGGSGTVQIGTQGRLPWSICSLQMLTEVD